MKNRNSAPCDFYGYMDRVGMSESTANKHIIDAYHTDIANLFHKAYGRKFDAQELYEFKTQFTDATSWYTSLSEEQRQRVEQHIVSQAS